MCAAIGLALIVVALAARQSWLDRHFLPSFFLPRLWYTRIETAVRAALAAIGLTLMLARAAIARAAAGLRRYAIPAICAALAALAASEMVLRQRLVRPTEWLLRAEEPRRRADERLGWVLESARVGRSVVGGRTIEYAIDRSGYRVRTIDEPVDPSRPAILFVGESVMFGEGLPWDDTIPARVGRLLAIQPANLAVHGYGSDQAYMRLAAELPHFERPAAVVALFMTALFGRNVDDDRPHLEPGLVWRPAEPSSRLAALAGLVVPFRRDATVARGVELTRDVLRATVRLAQSRGAAPLIVVPQMGRESQAESALRHRVLDDTGVPYIYVELNPAWHVPWDRHPNGAAARVIAEAVVERLRGTAR